MTQYPNAPYGSTPAGGPVGGFSPAELEDIKKKALIWTIAGFLCGGVISGVLGLIGYLKADTEPQTAKTLTKWAMIVTIAMIVLNVIVWGLVILVNVIGIAAMSSAGNS